MTNINIYIAIVFLTLNSCTKKEEIFDKKEVIQGNTIQITPLQATNAGIETNTFAQESIAKSTELLGTTETTPESFAKLSSPVSGIIKFSNWIEGMAVKKGQILVRISDPSIVQIQEDYLISKSNENLAKNDFARQKNLNVDMSSSDKNLQLSQNIYNNQMITKNALAKKLRLIGINPEKVSTTNLKTSIDILAPFSGIITKANVNSGQFVNTSDLLFEIQNTQKLHLVLKVFEKDLSSIFINQKLLAFSTINPKKAYSAQVHLISNNFDEQRRVLVHCDFDNPTPDLYSGMMLKIISEGKTNHSLSLPEDAVVSFENKTYVFVALANNKYEMKAVKIGELQNKRQSILDVSPELQQSKIVVKGAYNLLMAMKNIEE